MKRTLVALAALALVAAPAAHAQRPISVGVAAGVSTPSGDLADAVKTGYHAMVSAAFHAPLMPVGLRVDGMFNQLGDKAGGDVHLNILGLTGNVTYSFPGVMVKPYIIGGIGFYNSKVSVSGATSSNDFGINGGAGASFALSGFNVFAEARYHQIMSKDSSTGQPNMQLIPITVGIMF
jgi:hypothetical protein